MKGFTFVPVLSGGQPLPDVTVTAENLQEAHKLAFATLSSAQQDNLEYLDWVDTENI